MRCFFFFVAGTAVNATRLWTTVLEFVWLSIDRLYVICFYIGVRSAIIARLVGRPDDQSL